MNLTRDTFGTNGQAGTRANSWLFVAILPVKLLAMITSVSPYVPSPMAGATGQIGQGCLVRNRNIVDGLAYTQRLPVAQSATYVVNQR